MRACGRLATPPCCGNTALPPTPRPVLASAALTLAAMIAFAANSLLCRAALAEGAIDATSFTSLRLVSGALVLWLLLALRRAPAPSARPRPAAALLLFAYAIGFSLAYLQLTAATGALLLFGAVQGCMLVAALRAGERPKPLQWCGWLLALGGLVALLAPGLHAPAPLPAALMLGAGIAWGGYSLIGRGSRDPVADTAHNFLRAAPMALAASLLALLLADPVLTIPGVLLALASGALASGLGYVLWYAALPALSATAAASVQLSVPALTALLAVLLLGEALQPRLLLAGPAILGGIALAVLVRRAPRRS